MTAMEFQATDAGNVTPVYCKEDAKASGPLTTLEGMYEGAPSIPWAILGGIAHGLGRYRTLNRDMAFFTSLDDNAASSKMKARLPQAYQSLVDHLTANGPVQNLYISPAAMRTVIQDENVLYQTVNDIGVTQEQFNRAEELGADIEVPLNLYQGKIAGTDVSLALRGEVRTNPEGMTLAEQTAFPVHVERLASRYGLLFPHCRQRRLFRHYGGPREFELF